MPSAPQQFWTLEEEQRLVRLRKIRPELPWSQYPSMFAGRSPNAIRKKYYTLQHLTPAQILTPSPYPSYDSPLEMEGDALVLPDPSIPFHHAEFINRCLILAEAWGIDQCILAGDAVHFTSLSKWSSDWISADEKKAEVLIGRLWAIVGELEWEDREELDREELDRVIDDLEENLRPPDGGAGTELRETRKQLKRLGECFTRVDFVMGNHESRLLRLLNTSLFATDLAEFLGLDPVFRIAPYYYSLLHSGGEPFRVTHPSSAAKYSAQYLADKYQQHILMAHSHRVSMIPSKSGRFLGWQIGHTADESKLPYAAQRDTPRDANVIAAAIVRNGTVWLLSQNWTDWEALLQMT